MWCKSLISILFLISCTEVQLMAQQQVSSNATSKAVLNSACESMSFYAKSLSDPDYRYSNFTKTIDPTTRKVKTIEAGIYSGGGISKWIKFDVIYHEETISLVLAESSSDTAIHIKMNNDGFADYTIDGNNPDGNFPPTNFKYKNGKVISRSIQFNGKELVANFNYDQNSNLVLIQEHSSNGELPGRSEYSYDVKRRAKNQAYFDEPRGFAENTYMLLQYMDLLPLKPVNIRTASKVFWEDNYKVYDVMFSDQMIDGNGNLISYKSQSSLTNLEISQFDINWTCE